MNTSPTTTDLPVIEMEEVAIGSLHAPGQVVVESVNWTVAPGEFWIVAGHHASGKSDLLLTAAGLMGPLRGSHRFLGERMPVFEDSRLAVRVKVGLVFNSGRLIGNLSFADNITLPICYHLNLSSEVALERVAPILEATQLRRFAEQLPGTLGRHWDQRVGLARALALDPELLLLDDPLSGLDAHHASWWVEFLAKLARGGHPFRSRPMTLVVAADSLSPWRHAATHCAVLEGGHWEVLGSVQAPEVVQHPKAQDFWNRRGWRFDPPPGI